MNLFKTKVKLLKQQENGDSKFITEEYVVEAFTFTDAEYTILDQINQMGGISEYLVDDIGRVDFSEVFNKDDNSADKWFSAKLAFIVLDEKTYKEKKQFKNVLLKASDMDNAMTIIKDNMKSTMSDYTIDKVAETKILDLFLK